jgi:thioredoxin-dependent peroxiredoxin
MLEEGDRAPDFELPDQDGQTHKLSDYAGKNVVLYFYPKALTSGCTVQACGVRDRAADYEAANAVVLGVSPDPQKKLRKFADEEDLNFTLLGDEDHSVAEKYDVWVEKSMYGRKYWGVQRATFIVAPDGVIKHVIPKVKPATHDDEVLGLLAGAPSS